MKTIEFRKILPRDYPRQHHYMRVSEMLGLSINDDLSGRYVPAEVAERLLAAIKQVDDFLNDYHSENNVHLVVRSAIKQAEEG